MQPLDNPVWHALTGPHATVAEGGALARRYRPEYSVWSAMHDDADPMAWAELHSLVGDGGHALFGGSPQPPPDWDTVRSFPVQQMVLDAPIEAAGRGPTFAAASLEQLSAEDADAMGALARATEPGSWCERTPELGDFFGVRVDGELAAMAGGRLRLPTAVEISGVCTAERYRAKGYAAALVVEVARQIQGRGDLAFLHVRETNPAAIRLYERLGFRCRSVRAVTLVRAPAHTR